MHAAVTSSLSGSLARHQRAARVVHSMRALAPGVTRQRHFRVLECSHGLCSPKMEKWTACNDLIHVFFSRTLARLAIQARDVSNNCSLTDNGFVQSHLRPSPVIVWMFSGVPCNKTSAFGKGWSVRKKPPFDLEAVIWSTRYARPLSD